ncbi:MAG: hypothetical protein ACYDAX_13605 [Desulfobacteria bacterium]
MYAEVAKTLSLLRVLLLLATEGDTKVGAGQSQDRGLPQGVVDHDTILGFFNTERNPAD